MSKLSLISVGWPLALAAAMCAVSVPPARSEPAPASIRQAYQRGQAIQLPRNASQSMINAIVQQMVPVTCARSGPPWDRTRLEEYRSRTFQAGRGLGLSDNDARRASAFYVQRAAVSCGRMRPDQAVRLAQSGLGGGGAPGQTALALARSDGVRRDPLRMTRYQPGYTRPSAAPPGVRLSANCRPEPPRSIVERVFDAVGIGVPRCVSVHAPR